MCFCVIQGQRISSDCKSRLRGELIWWSLSLCKFLWAKRVSSTCYGGEDGQESLWLTLSKEHEFQKFWLDCFDHFTWHANGPTKQRKLVSERSCSSSASCTKSTIALPTSATFLKQETSSTELKTTNHWLLAWLWHYLAKLTTASLGLYDANTSAIATDAVPAAIAESITVWKDDHRYVQLCRVHAKFDWESKNHNWYSYLQARWRTGWSVARPKGDWNDHWLGTNRIELFSPKFWSATG